MKRIDWKAVRHARAGLTGTAREGLLLVVNAERFTAAWQYRADVNTVLDEVRARLPELRHTQIGRLQVLALTLLKLQRDGVPREQWWPVVRPHLEALEGAAFSHFLPELFAAETSIYEGLGLTAGAARRLPLSTIGAPHGPWLEFLVAGLDAVGQERRTAGDAPAAEAGARLARRLLREWIVAPGTAGLRMLAAELLVAQTAQTTSAGDSAAVPIAECRDLREVYRRCFPTLGRLPAVFRVEREPEGFLQGLFFADSVAAAGLMGTATAAACVLALATCIFWLRARATVALSGRDRLVTILTALLITAGAAQVLYCEHPGYDDFQRLADPTLGWPHLPLAMSAYVLTAYVIAGGALALWPRKERRHGLARAACLSAITWLALSATTTLLIAFRVTAEARDYERRLAGTNVMTWEDRAPASDGPLEVLQRWRP